jgi:iron complex outermembrane receptor protein
MNLFLKTPFHHLKIVFLTICFFFSSLSFGAAKTQKELTKEQLEIFDMDIYQLMQQEVTVTSPSKRPQKLHSTASAIYVLTQEDIQRSGAVNIMEALRMVPGVLVSKINQNSYVVSIRGFNRRFGSDKLLVLMDGRTIYSPSVAGVFWVGQDTVLEDIDRIEVIRGPGAALWGSNAVAGVINIITKETKKTNGSLASGGIGTEEEGFATIRYGEKIKEGLDYRVYGKFRNRDDGENASGVDTYDHKKMQQYGLRSDWQKSKNDNFTLQGDYYRVEAETDIPSRFVSFDVGSTPFQGIYDYSGANILSRWTRTLEKDSSIKLQAYYDFFRRKSDLPFDERTDQFDLELQHDFKVGKRHDLSWGLNYRYSLFDFKVNQIFQLDTQSTDLFGFFVHDEIKIVPDKWSLILGAKLEHNDFTGLEVQPNARMLWTPKENHTLWAAFSRAIRIPTITEDLRNANRILIPGATPLLIQDISKGVSDPEELLAYEMGYRYNVESKFYFDLTGYYFDYQEIIESKVDTVFFESSPITHLVLPLTNDNAVAGEVFGFEVAMQWQPLSNLRLSTGYTFAQIDLRPTLANTFIPASVGGEGDLDSEGEPDHIFNARAYFNLTPKLQLDPLFYLVSKNTTRNVSLYTRFDLRLGWKPNKNTEISLVGQNLFDPKHPESTELLERNSETQRSFYGKLTFRF